MDTVSVCLTPETYRLAKAAFLADWHAGGTADTLGDWIAGACLRHAHLTSAASRPSRNPALRAATQLHHRRPGPGRRGCCHRRRLHRRILDHPLRMGPDRRHHSHPTRPSPCRRYPPHPTRPAPRPASAKGFAMAILSLLLPVAVLGFIEVAWWGLGWIEVQQTLQTAQNRLGLRPLQAGNWCWCPAGAGGRTTWPELKGRGGLAAPVTWPATTEPPTSRQPGRKTAE